MNTKPTLRKAPITFTSTNIVIRMIDTIGFRYNCAIFKLDDSIDSFRPADSQMSFLELQEHIFDLLKFINKAINPNYQKSEFSKEKIHQQIEIIRERLNENNFKPEDVEIYEKDFWHVISGPLSDILTHIGQLNTYRSMAGNKNKKISYFKGIVSE